MPNQSAAANRRPAGQLDGSGNLSATVAADRAFLGLLGICQRTITAHYAPPKRAYRLIKPYPTKATTLGEHLRKKRLDEGLTQVQLAAKLGVSQSSIDKWEGNKTMPPLRYRSTIAAFLGFSWFGEASHPTAQ